MKLSHASQLEQRRARYRPDVPLSLKNIRSLERIEIENRTTISSEIEALFPHTSHLRMLTYKPGRIPLSIAPLIVGVVFSGGQAPGGHTVIAALFDALKELHPSSQLIGFLGGPNGIVTNQWIDLTEEIILPYRNQGGFDLLGSGRTKIETLEQFHAVKQTLIQHSLDGLLIIGGDDSNTNAAYLAEFCLQNGLKTCVVGVPKTIDGDLKNDCIELSFGFDTASKIYSEIIGNLLKDAISAKKYYFFVKMMGRSASHLTLECALQTHVNLALIGEEVAANRETLGQIVGQIADLICERAQHNKNFGVILLPEGLLEFIPEFQQMIFELNRLLHESISLQTAPDRIVTIGKQLTPASAACFLALSFDIQNQLLLDRDSYGNIQLSKIDTERLFILLVEKELEVRKKQGIDPGNFNPQPLFCGYEGRAGLPSNFDCQYCYSLGRAAALLIQHRASGYMCCIQNLTQSVEQWKIIGVPIVQMLHFEIRKNKKQAVIKKALVDVKGPVFTAFAKQRKQWRLDDFYCCPGPIQFEGECDWVDQLPLTLRFESTLPKI